MTFYRNRYYHPGLGRFASRDPMGMADSVSPYAYVGNAPTNLIDPMGLLAQLTGTPMNAAYWGMLADASFNNPGTMTDVRGGGGGGTFTPGQQRLPSITGSQALDALQLGLDIAGLTEPFGFAADLVNSGISYGRGDTVGGSLSLGAAVPFIGAAATVGKFGAKGADAVGGAYKDVKGIAGNHAHHTPANSASPLSKSDGPCISMCEADHKMTASFGSSKEARAYREQQKNLIEQGRFREAQQMDITDIQSKFGGKYDEAIKQMLDYTKYLGY